MSDVRLLLKEKADIETAMQRDLAPHIRVFAQQELDKVCKKIEEASAEWNKLFEQQELDQLKQRVKELEASNKELLEALKKLVKFVEGSGMEFGRIHREKWIESYDVMENARQEIQKAKRVAK